MNRSNYIYREYPKMLMTLDGLVIVQGIDEERAIMGTASVASDTAEAQEAVGALPTAETQGASRVLGAWQPGAPAITAQDQAEW
jgi:hypothetical protein